MDVSKCGHLFAQQLSDTSRSLDTVRALHQTVVSLRAALDKSREELRALHAKVQAHVETNVYEDTIEKLSLENHVLRQRFLNTGSVPECIKQLTRTPSVAKLDLIGKEPEPMETETCIENESRGKDEPEEKSTGQEQRELPLRSMSEETKPVNVKLDLPVRSVSEDGELSCSESGTPQGSKTAGESDNESEELDDIELIFTTEETKELGVLQEDLVSITDSEAWPNKSSKSDKVWMQSVLVETDISKCGVVDELEGLSARASRRNTLPTPSMYQPIIHREILGNSRGQPSRPLSVKFAPATSPVVQSPTDGMPEYGKSPVRPILVERNSAKRESEAQTDITALPSQWRSESYLAHKVSHNFTTLPSKFALPIMTSKFSLKLSDKTQEARRTLLSDINFTSMVPELSRSADYLCQEGMEDEGPDPTPNLCSNYPRAHSYMKNADYLVSPGLGYSREYRDPWSPCNCAQGRSVSELYQGSTPRYRGSLTSIAALAMYENPDPRRRHSWRPTRSSSVPHRPTWGSVPSSPTHCPRGHSMSSYTTPRSDINIYSSGFWPSSHYATKSRPRNKVTFHESSHRSMSHPGQSLPDLRVDLDHDSGDSTDSLIDEAEEYLRRSIDSILTGCDWGRVGWRRQNRRHLEPDPIREFVPPQSAQPFLPKIPRDLKLDYFVKVITSEGRVMVGRVRYVGPVPARIEHHIGVELPQDSGNTDGTFQGRRFFDCDPNKAIFVPFKKVVMAWSV